MYFLSLETVCDCSLTAAGAIAGATLELSQLGAGTGATVAGTGAALITGDDTTGELLPFLPLAVILK